MYLLGLIIGAAIITFLMVNGINFVLKRFLSNPLASFGISAIASAVLATVIYGLNSGDYLFALYIYGVACAIWFAVGVSRATKKQQESERKRPTHSTDSDSQTS